MDFNYSSPSVDINDLLYNAELITNAFSKVLEENNCLLMLCIGLHQNINSNIKDLEDLVENVSDTNEILDGNTETGTATDILNIINDIVEDLKSKCFQCDLKFPDIDFNINLKGIIDDLKAQIALFKNIFNFNKIDLCQSAYSLQNSCVPDILRLITLLLTAFVSIMTLRKISNISIAAFIKGVLSTLLSKITQSLKITVNIGSTNISCLINTLQEIALAIPTQENIEAKLDLQQKVALGLVDSNGDPTGSNKFRSSTVDGLNNTLNSNSSKLASFDKEISNAENQLNESFKLINSVVDFSLDEINNYIQSLLNFQTYFECETKRSGMDVEEAISIINNLIQVINMLSSLALSMVKKNIREDACKNENTINNLSETDIDDLQIKDLLEDMNQSIVEIINSDDNALEVIIHDGGIKNPLPKLDLLDCSINDFVEAHTLPKLIELAKKQVEQENNRQYTSKPDSNYIFKKPSGKQKETINSIVDLIYTKPVKEDIDEEEEKIIVDIKNPIGTKGLSSILSETIRNDKSQTNLACKSVEDVLSILNNIKR